MSELKPCPFDGKMPERIEDIDGVFAQCSDVGCQLHYEYTVAEWWNTRPIEDALQAKLDECEDSLKDCRLALRAKCASWDELDVMYQTTIDNTVSANRKLEIAKEALRIISEKTITATTTTSANPFIKIDYFSTEEASIAKNALKQLEAE